MDSPASPNGKATRLTIGQVIAEERRNIQCVRAELRQRLKSAGRKSSEGGIGDSDFPAGLALSGGGVRSATFNLGVLQALAAEGLLARFDYLSTVSGGGYIGGWLSAWIHRTARKGGRPVTAQESADALVQVQAALANEKPGHDESADEQPPDRAASTAATESEPGFIPPTTREPRTISWLRTCSRYLAPKAGALSIDSVTLVTTWARNVFLNSLIIFSLLAALLLFMRLLADWLHQGLQASLPLGELTAALGAACFMTFAVQLYSQDGGVAAVLQRSVFIARWFGSYRWTLGLGFAYLVAAGLWAASFDSGNRDADSLVACGTLVSIGISLLAAGAASLRMERALDMNHDPSIGPRSGPDPREALIFGLAGIVSVAAAVGCFLILRSLLAGDGRDLAKLIEQMTFAPALALVTFGVCGSLFVGVAGRVYGEGSREWWARLNASFLRAGLIALLVTGLAFGAGLVDWLLERSSGWLGALVASGWVGSALAALLGSRVTAKTDDRQRLLMRVLNACAIVFSAGLVLLASLAVHNGLNAAVRALAPASVTWPGTDSPSPCAEKVRPHARGEVELDIGETSLQRIADELRTCLSARTTKETAAILGHDQARRVVGYGFLFCLCTFLLLGWRVDVNRFSLHDLYKVRLIRCYLGASRLGSKSGKSDRKPNPFTGFDAEDDFELADISPNQRPLHLVNAAVNLTLDTHLAWQDRKAASFTFSPLHCGFVPPSGEALMSTAAGSDGGMESFVRTERYGRGWEAGDAGVVESVQRSVFGKEGEGLTMGSAIATSGAAVSPASGANTQPALAFLLTVFNLRTGRWSPNPRARRTNSVSPRFGPWWLLRELFGFTSMTGSYVHLSDGGHFDNLGVYELVRRRCKLIVCVDASADPNRQFGDLGNLVRRCRVDFGADIDIDTRKLAVDAAKGLSAALVQKGSIAYPDDKPGVFLYIKPGLVESEPAELARDILSHHVSEPTFPHVTTADQFFNEPQFESYRKLGEYAGLSASKSLAARGNT